MVAPARQPPPDRPGVRRRPPLDSTALEELALVYVARFASSAAGVAAYLRRKLRERGWIGEGDPGAAAEALAERLVALGYVDDAAFARNRSAGLLRRGYGARRIEQALRGAGIGGDEREAVRASPGEARAAALRLAQKRGFGPFGPGGIPDRAARDRQIAAMLRAGHPLDSARTLIDAGSAAEARQWAGEDEAE